ncbi:MAG: PQQ-dependent sugar dehydrogenase, partial [Pirellulales bacterium]
MSSAIKSRFVSRQLRVEWLEPRLLLAGDTYLINFQSGGSTPIPTRYLADTGQDFGVRPSGLSYGWSSDHTDQARDRNLVADQRLDTLIHFEVGQNWGFQLANGLYEVTVAVGDPANNDGIHTINAEGVNFWNAVPDTSSAMVQTHTVTVSDGRLTLDQGAAADKATRINYIHIVGLPNGPNGAPATPTITEPNTDGQVVSPSDVHMEAIGFFDPDGNAHKSTDWVIWTTGAGAEPVWQTLGIGSLERLHTHMGDGIFINSHAGRTDLMPNADYELRVRFRDDAGSVSAYAIRTFHTGDASTILPFELSDVTALSPEYWIDSSDNNVVLPAGNPGRQLRLESAGGELLLSIAGNNGVVNSITNPPALLHHDAARIVITAGSSALNLGPTELRVITDLGLERAIFLPIINLAAGQRLDLWVASGGSTYYGSAEQTEPDFSSAARLSDLPFTAMQAGFVVEEVAGDFQLPVNIAFVPNPGPDPDDPLFYVTELYGTIKMVTRDFGVSVYATGLLNFNPTGAFPGSGEQGLAGIVVDPLSGDLYVTRVRSSSSNPDDDNAPHYPQVVRLTSSDGGRTASSITVIRDMVGETMGQSHQISNITIGLDGKLYVHVGDGFDYTTAQNLNSYRGKVLRMNLNGSAPTDNPFYNGGTINARDFVFAYGLRNPFGGAWRASDGKHYEVENGPSVDRLAQINQGVNYGWNNSDLSMFTNAIYNWVPSHAPVNITFVQSTTFAGSQFPVSEFDHAFVSESGPTYAEGPQSRGKRIVEFVIDANGNHVGGPTTLVEYTGAGQGTVAGLNAGPDRL